MKKSLSRRAFLQTAGLGAAAFSLTHRIFAAERKPNIVVILVDDLGWADTVCYGSRYYETPNIDRLAAEGMRFTNGYAACAVCSPTRASLLTGRYPARVGVTDWIRPRFQSDSFPTDKKNPTAYVGGKNQKLLCPPNPFWMELEEVTLAETLKPAGYTCGHVGKWHLGPDDWFPDKQGFDINIGGCDFGQPPNYFDPYVREKQGGIPTLPPRRTGEYLTDREADEATRFITQHADRPFFLYMAHYAVHTPLQAKQDLIEKYQAKPPTEQNNPTYAAMIESVDQAVGRILSTLDDTGLVGNTIVIFTSDNGGLLKSTSNLPLRSGKGYPYEGGIREPVIVRWPGVVRPGSLCDVPVCSIDYFPTLCAAAGVALPPGRVIDGESLMPLLRESGEWKRDALFWHFPHYRGEDVVPYSIIRAGDWKLIKQYEGKPFELFDLKNDMAETTDLSEKLPEKVQELDARLAAWLKDTGAKVPMPNPGYAPE